MATTGWGLVYFNIFNIFKIHNLHTSLPLSSRSAWHLRSSRPFVICCIAQSTFLPILPIPALFSLKLGRGALFPASPASLCQSWLRQSRETNLCQLSRGWPKKKAPFRAPWFLLDFHSQNEKRFIGQHSNGPFFWNHHFLLRPVVTSDDVSN